MTTDPTPFSHLPAVDPHDDPYEEANTRAVLWEYLGADPLTHRRPEESRLRHAAASVGLHPNDLLRFWRGEAGLTFPARARLRQFMKGRAT